MLEFPSVGATENLLTAAVLAKGETVIENAAREPEITDLADMLNRMGAEVHGAGTSTLVVEGVEELVPVESEIMADRIETGTLLMAVRHRRRRGRRSRARASTTSRRSSMKLGEMGLQVTPTPDGSGARADERMRAVDIATLPFPGFATDFMPLRGRAARRPPTARRSSPRTCSTTASASSPSSTAWAPTSVTRAGTRWCAGVPRLSAAPVRALDVRAGAALVLAGLAADGETVVLDPFHVDRGYSDLAAIAAHARRRRRARPRLALTGRCPGSPVRSDPARSRSKGIGRPSAGGREPKGKRHAIDTDTGVVACGTPESLRIFEDWPWAPEDDWCQRVREKWSTNSADAGQSAIGDPVAAVEPLLVAERAEAAVPGSGREVGGEALGAAHGERREAATASHDMPACTSWDGGRPPAAR